MDTAIPAQLANMKRTTWPGDQAGVLEDAWKDEAVGSSNGLTYVFKVEYAPFTGQYSALVLDQYSGKIRRQEVFITRNEDRAREWLLQKWHEMKCLP